jgi:hypothetical protein
MKLIYCILTTFSLTASIAQSGMFSLGGRTTVSLFNDGGTDNLGTGLGGQFRLQFADRVNSDWFFDYLTSDIGSVGNRTDYHIGWSVLFYPYLNDKRSILLKPFFLAGHCFDYTRFETNFNPANFDERWSSAVQGGIGTHLNLTQKLDLTMLAQYMIHLGNHIHAEADGQNLIITESHGASLEGHVLLTFGINYKIGELW